MGKIVVIKKIVTPYHGISEFYKDNSYQKMAKLNQERFESVRNDVLFCAKKITESFEFLISYEIKKFGFSETLMSLQKEISPVFVEDLFMDNMFKVNAVLEYGELKEFIFEQDVKKDADNLVKCLRIVLNDLRIERERKNREIQRRETNLRKFHAYRMFCDF